MSGAAPGPRPPMPPPAPVPRSRGISHVDMDNYWDPSQDAPKRRQLTQLEQAQYDVGRGFDGEVAFMANYRIRHTGGTEPTMENVYAAVAGEDGVPILNLASEFYSARTADDRKQVIDNALGLLESQGYEIPNDPDSPARAEIAARLAKDATNIITLKNEADNGNSAALTLVNAVADYRQLGERQELAKEAYKQRGLLYKVAAGIGKWASPGTLANGAYSLAAYALPTRQNIPANPNRRSKIRKGFYLGGIALASLAAYRIGTSEQVADWANQSWDSTSNFFTDTIPDMFDGDDQPDSGDSAPNDNPSGSNSGSDGGNRQDEDRQNTPRTTTETLEVPEQIQSEELGVWDGTSRGTSNGEYQNGTVYSATADTLEAWADSQSEQHNLNGFDVDISELRANNPNFDREYHQLIDRILEDNDLNWDSARHMSPGDTVTIRGAYVTEFLDQQNIDLPTYEVEATGGNGNNPDGKNTNPNPENVAHASNELNIPAAYLISGSAALLGLLAGTFVAGRASKKRTQTVNTDTAQSGTAQNNTANNLPPAPTIGNIVRDPTTGQLYLPLNPELEAWLARIVDMQNRAANPDDDDDSSST